MKDEKMLSIIDLVKILWKHKMFIGILVAAFLLLGVVQIISIPKEYSSNLILMPQAHERESTVSGFNQLAGLAGVNLQNQSAGIDKKLYPEILNSNLFYISFMNQRFEFGPDKDTLTLFDILKEYEDRSLFEKIYDGIGSFPGSVLGIFRKSKPDITEDSSTGHILINDLLILNSTQKQVISKLKERVYLKEKSINGLMVITCELPDPSLSAHAVVYVKEYLTVYLTKYQTDKEKENLVFLEKQLLDAKAKFVQVQLNLAKRRDSNQNLITTSAQTEEQRLQAEFSLAFSIYNDIAKQVEQAKIQIQKNTPYFSVLEPSQISTNHSTPNEKIILIIALMLGVFTSVAWVLFKELILLNLFNKK